MMTKINADNLKYLTLMQKKAAILMLEGRSYVEQMSCAFLRL